MLYNMGATICLAHSCHSGGSPGGRIRHNEKIVSAYRRHRFCNREIADSRDLTKRIDIGGHDNGHMTKDRNGKDEIQNLAQTFNEMF